MSSRAETFKLWLAEAARSEYEAIRLRDLQLVLSGSCVLFLVFDIFVRYV
jgi:hypothetical protein